MHRSATLTPIRRQAGSYSRHDPRRWFRCRSLPAGEPGGFAALRLVCSFAGRPAPSAGSTVSRSLAVAAGIGVAVMVVVVIATVLMVAVVMVIIVRVVC